jgi:hypothetical protein
VALTSNSTAPARQEERRAEPREARARPGLPAFALAGWRVSVDVPHLLLVAAAAGWCGWFWFDSYAAAADIENLSLIEPTAIAALLLCAAILRDCIQIRRAEEPSGPPRLSRPPLEPTFRARLLGTMALLALYVAISPFSGFDIATFAYILATLFFLGERRVWVLVLTPAIVCVVAIYAFNTILATPLPLFFGGEP